MGTAASAFHNPIAAELDSVGVKPTANTLLRRATQRRQIQGMIGVSYIIDAFVLLIYSHAGTIPATIGPAYAACGLVTVAGLRDVPFVFARAGASPVEGVHANVNEAVAGVTDEMLPVAAEKEIELRVERLDPCVVGCSVGVLTSLLSNLVGNAIKYIWRAGLKGNAVEDIEKARQYLDFELQRIARLGAPGPARVEIDEAVRARRDGME